MPKRLAYSDDLMLGDSDDEEETKAKFQELLDGGKEEKNAEGEEVGQTEAESYKIKVRSGMMNDEFYRGTRRPHDSIDFHEH